MSATVETSIWLALRSRVESIPLPYPKAWPGEVFEVPHDGQRPAPFLRIGRVSVPPVSRLIAYGQPHDRSGALMVTLVRPLGQDVAVYDQQAGLIAAHFADGTTMRHGGVCVSVPSYPHAQDGYEENGYWTAPVRIPWRCFA